MTLKAVHRELEAFLVSKVPQVLCIRGRWGVGKTYQWNRILKATQKEEKIPFRSYSYVSLFGINSLSEFRVSIFENHLPLKTDDKMTNFDKLDRYMSSKLGWRKKARFLSFIPGLNGLSDSDAAGALASLTTHEQLICVDDIERRGRDLDLKDVLGLVSFLKEQRACKIVVIINDEELTQDDQQDFVEILEKLVDVSITFTPTTEEAAKAAFDNPDEVNTKVAGKCVKLGITNIRVIRRIDRLIRALQPILDEYSTDVFDTALSSVVLFSWAKDQPKEAPSLEFIKSLSSQWAYVASGDELEENSEVKAAWRAKLEDYGYTRTDEFDLALIDGVVSGYFTPEQIKPYAKIVDDRVIAAKADGSFERSWEAYHGSFGENTDEVLDGIYEAFKRNYHTITPLSVNETVTVFKELGREAQAQELIELYIDGREEDHRSFDLNDYSLSRDITDPDLRAAFSAKTANMKPPRNFKEALLSIKDGWGQQQLKIISEAPVEKFVETFKDCSGAELRRLLSNAMQFSSIANPSPEIAIIAAHTKEALTEIGKESAINARRVRRFGVIISEEDVANIP